MIRGKTLTYLYRGNSYSIQQKKWYGWKTLSIFSSESEMLEALKFIRKSREGRY